MSNSVICRRTNARPLMLTGLMFAAILLLLPMTAAQEKHTPLSEPVLTDAIAAYPGEELYGISSLAGSVDGSQPAKVDNEIGADISFIIAGEVSNPGEYFLRPPVTLLKAIMAAGGPSSYGSMRRIKAYQGETLLGEYDLYRFLSEGRIEGDFIFNGGEQIVVLPCGPRVSISGGVKIPAVFELKEDEMLLARALEFAGGLSSGMGRYRVEVVRVADSKRDVAFSADVEIGAEIPVFSLEPGDRIRVLGGDACSTADVYVQLPGNVCRNISYRPDMRISNLLGHLQPLPENIALNYAEILREGRSDKKYDVIGISIDSLLRQIDLGDASNDLILFPGDRLMLFDRDFLDKKPVVGVEVKGRPLILVAYKPGMTICDLLDAVDIGRARKKLQATIYRRQLRGSKLDVVSLVVDVDAARRKSQRQNIKLQPFDTLLLQH